MKSRRLFKQAARHNNEEISYKPFSLASLSLPFAALELVGAPESEICTDVSRHAMPLNNALTIGNISAPKKVIAFVDPDRGVSARLHREMKKVVEKRKDIVFYLKLYPCKSYNSLQKSKSIICNRSMKMLEGSFERIRKQ